MRRESASLARGAASRALEAEATREKRVAEARRASEKAKAESARLRDALAEARAALDASEAERFELRRALEAHVGALVEAKVDEAARAGELEAMREDVDDMRRRYEAATARAVALETRQSRARDSARFDALVDGGSPRASRRSPRGSLGAASLALSDDAEARLALPADPPRSEKSARKSSGHAEQPKGFRDPSSPRARRRAGSPFRRRRGSPRSACAGRASGSDEERVEAAFAEKID